MRSFNPKRFRVLKNGYIFDKRIFQVTIILLIISFVFIAYKNNFSNSYYFGCEQPIGCELTEFHQEFCSKPLTKLEKFKAAGLEEWLSDSGLCETDFVPQGFSYGEPPSWFAGLEAPLTIILILLGFFVNHILYNKDFNFGGFDNG